MTALKMLADDEDRIAVGTARACYMLDCGESHLRKLIVSGDLETFLDGSRRRVTVESIRRYIERQIAASPPLRRRTGDRNVKQPAA
jgi:hypothetical protein